MIQQFNFPGSIVEFRASISTFNFIIQYLARESQFKFHFFIRNTCSSFHFPIQRQIPHSDCQFSISFHGLDFSSIFYSTIRYSARESQFKFHFLSAICGQVFISIFSVKFHILIISPAFHSEIWISVPFFIPLLSVKFRSSDSNSECDFLFNYNR